jgi:uncharacterized protein (DUF849 family)
MESPLIMVAPNGPRLGQTDHLNLPLSLGEIITTAQECEANGAKALHLHIRTKNCRQTLDAGQYRETLTALNDTTNLRVQITIEAVGICDVEDQLACLKNTRSEWASVLIREIARNE